MPSGSGPQLAARLAALRPELKVLFVSGYPHDFFEGDTALDLRQNYLPKPFTASELLGRVRTLLGAFQPLQA
jgi:DNA-binding response OmpR family regulator